VPLQCLSSEENWKTEKYFHFGLQIVFPFTLIVTMNTAVVATLCKRRFQHSTMSTNRTGYVDVFFNNLTGLAFVLSNAIDAMGFIMSLFNVHTFVSWWLIIRLSQCMYVFLWLCDKSSYLFYRVQKR